MILLVPQPIYYIAGEVIKVSGDYNDLFYPNKWEFVWQLVLICLLYAPSFGLYYMNGRMLRTCIERVHPAYNFETHELCISKPLPKKSGVVTGENDEHSPLTNGKQG